MISPNKARPNPAVAGAAAAEAAKVLGKPPGSSIEDLMRFTESVAATCAPRKVDPMPQAGASDARTGTRDARTDASGASIGASAKQIDANRANARKSTGPRTEAGKARSSQNALRHGLFAKAAVLPGEDAQEYARLTMHLFMIYAPSSEEEDLVATLARKTWMLRRIQAAEAEMGKTLAEQGKTAARALADDYMGIGNGGLLRMMNHEMRLSNSILSIKAKLAKLQKDRPQAGYDGEGIGDLTQYSEASLRELLGASDAPLDGSKPNGADDATARENEADSGVELTERMQNKPDMPGSAPPVVRVA